MIKMQDLVLNQIEKVAGDYELKAVISYGTSNTGIIYIMDKLEHVAIIHFNFQTSYCSLEFHNENDIKLKHMSNGYLEYKDTKKLKIFLNNMDNYLREYDMEQAGYMED